jgi:hypothetical protein
VGIKEGEEVQVNDIHNIFNKVIAENFTNIKKEMPIQVQDSSRTPNRYDQYASPWYIIIKTTSTENKEIILKAVREKNQTTY